VAGHWKWNFWRKAYVNDLDGRTIRSGPYSGRTAFLEYHDGDRYALVSSEDTFDGITIWPERTREWIAAGNRIPMTAPERAEIVDDIRSALKNTKLTVSQEEPLIQIQSDAGEVRITVHETVPGSLGLTAPGKYYRINIGGVYLDKDRNRVHETDAASYIPEKDWDVTRYVSR
jgi:hypothetical protein